MAMNAGTQQLLNLSRGGQATEDLAAQRIEEQRINEAFQAANRAEQERLAQERQTARQAYENLARTTQLQRLPTTDYGLDWQNRMMNQLAYGGNIPQVMTGGTNPINTYDILGYYDRGVGFGDYPTSVQSPSGMLDIYPVLGFGSSSDAAANLEEKNRIVRDVRGRFTPFYYNASSEGYSAPVGKSGPGGVLFNSGLGKTNENPGDYKTPGAGLWAAGFDPNDPFVLQKLYDYFGANRGPVWDKYKPQKNESGAWTKGTAEDALQFLTDADHWFRQEATKMDLPKRGIMDSMVGNLIVGGLVSAFTGGLGTIIGGLTNSTAIGNIASALASAGIGGAQGGLQGAITGGLGSAIGSGIDYAGGVGEFIQNPLDALAGAFDVGAGTVGGGVGGLLLDDMGSAAQVGPGSLAANTPPVTGPIVPTESVLVTAVMPDDTLSTGAWLASTLVNAGIPVRNNITYYADANGNLAGWFDPSSTDVNIRPPISIPPDTVAGAPVNQPEPSTGQTDAGTQASTGSASTGQTGTSGTQTGGGAAVGAGTGAVTGLLDPSTGGTTGSVPVGGGSTTSGAGLLDQNVTPVDQTATGGTGSTGGATGAVTGGTTGGTTGGVTGGVTGGTPGGVTGGEASPQEPTPVQVGSQEWLNQILATQTTTSPMELPVNPVNSWANSGLGQVQNFVTPQPEVPEPPRRGSQEWLNQVLATQATTTPTFPEMSVNSWANSGLGQIQNFVTPQPFPEMPLNAVNGWANSGLGQVQNFVTPQPEVPVNPVNGWAFSGTRTPPNFVTPPPTPTELSSQELINAILAGTAGNAINLGESADLLNSVNGWAFSGTGTPQDFVTPGVAGGGGIGLDTGTTPGTEFGAGFGDATGSGIGTGDSTGPGMGAGTGPGAGGLLTDTAPIVDQAVQPTNNPFDFGLPDLSMLTGGTPGGLGEATGSGIYGGKMGGFEAKYPKTPKKKKRGITVQIAGARRNG